MSLHRLLDSLHPQIDIVVGDNGRNDIDIGISSQTLFKSLDAHLEIGCTRDTGENGDLPFRAHGIYQQLGTCFSGLDIIQPEECKPIALRRICIPCHNRDPGGYGPIDGIDTGGGIVARDRDGVHLPGDNVIHHARLLGCI